MNLKNQRGKQPSGRRKAAQKATNKENTPCIMDTSPHPRPRPRPIRKDDNPSSKPSGGHTDIIETWQAPNSKEVMAAKALLNFNRHAASENTMDHIFRQVLKIPLDEALDDEGSEDQDGHEMEEVQPSDSEGDDSQFKQTKELARVEFEIQFKVPFNGAMRNLKDIMSKTSFERFLEAVAQRMET
ncbi:hypothetical protein H2248_007498 [Termitomyces sp. 'cryptogamus']|nr:hypothetical protein H2248_007498 [Termitomyces sp. 'cryptogamus']